ncbi:MAG: hypothetical protein BIFFINMI_01430 [Phycisphaerae bacterium]|nr:hypothetical protein [Phycisphaerae bacterium]
MNWQTALLLLPGLVIGLTLHESAHAWSASLLGDDYSRSRHRVSLNPFRHLSLLGTLALLVLPFGWARPVQVNVYNFRHPKRDFLVSSLAGPAANLLVVGACILCMLATRHSFWLSGRLGPAWGWLHHVLGATALINLILALVNLVPLPPLDGSKIWPVLSPRISIQRMNKATNLSMLVLLVIVFSGAADPAIRSAVDGAMRLFPVSDVERYVQLADAGGAAIEEGDFPAGRRHIDAALALNPDGVEALELRVWLDIHEGRWQQAESGLTRLRSLTAGSKRFKASIDEMEGSLVRHRAYLQLQAAATGATQPDDTASQPDW